MEHDHVCYWLHGSSFPKSLKSESNVRVRRGEQREVVSRTDVTASPHGKAFYNRKALETDVISFISPEVKEQLLVAII